MEAWVCPVTLGQSLLAHLKEVHKGRVYSQEVVSLHGQGKGEEECGGGKLQTQVVYTKMNNGVIIMETNFVLGVCLAQASLVPRPFHLQMAWV